MRLGLLLPIVLPAFLAAPLPAADLAGGMAPLAAMQDKPYGALLLGEGGDRDWQDALAAMARKLSPRFPLEFALGHADIQAIQRAVDRLQAARVKKIVVVPIFTTSNSPLMDETRFLFGVRKEPSPEFFRVEGAGSGYAVVRRVRTKLPVVLVSALDDSPAVADILVSRALGLSRKTADEAVVLVGLAPPAAPAQDATLGQSSAMKSAGAEDEYRQTLSVLAERVRAKGGFAAAQSAALSCSAHQSERDRSDDNLRKLVRELSRSRRVLVVLHAVTGELASRRVLRALQGTFMRYSGKGLLTDARLERWVEDAVQQGAALPDMRAFKDDGRALPAAGQPLRLKPMGWTR